MKTKRLLFLLVFLLASVLASAQNFSVKKFTADYYISKEGYFDVVEKYDVEFHTPSHGIFRDFVTKFKYKDAKGKVSKRTLYITDIDVPVQQFSTNEGLIGFFDNKLRIKIGDKDKLVDGLQHYEIKYRVKNALFFNGDIVEFYWNVKSPEWFSVFYQVDFTVHAPDGAVLSPQNCFVYAGQVGDTSVSTSFKYNYNGNEFTAFSDDHLMSSYLQSVTALVKLPKSLITEVDFTPPFTERYKWLGIILGILFSIFQFIKIRIKSVAVTPITSYYPPEDMDSALAGTLIDDLANPRDLQSLLPYWGSKGYIEMEEIPKGEQSLRGDIKLTKLKDLPENSPGYQFNIYRKLFIGRDEVYINTVRGVFREATQLLQQRTMEMYKSSKSKIKIVVLILSWIIAFYLITWFSFSAKNSLSININSRNFTVFIIIGYLFFFLVFPFLFAFVFNKMRAKTERGKQIFGELYGFRQFIKLAEVERIKTLLKDDPDYFEKTMPYAIAFNLLEEWTEKFEGLIDQTPQWYSSSSGTRFTMHSFASSMNNSMSVASISMISSTSSGSRFSSSSGGGSSGGGAGSGGGGSW